MIKIKKIIKRLILVLPVISFLTVYASIPDEISVTKGQNLSLRWGFYSNIPTDSIGRYDCDVKLLGLPVKTVSVSVNPERYVVPSGESIGVKIYTDGVLVVGLGSVCDKFNTVYEPAKQSGVRIGDRITEINGNRINSIEDFTRAINECSGQAFIKIVRNDREFTAAVNGIYSEADNCYKLGLWVRDSTAGIGTLTFYNPQNSTFGALGHGICDSDTGDVLIARKGSVNECKIINVLQGKKGSPGELVGSFKPALIGNITTNCSVGIFGTCKKIPDLEPVMVASRYQVKTGKAQVLCDIDGNGVSSYEIEITRIISKSSESNKDFVIKVTDKNLIEKTGGIVQGMSGSPIIQNERLVGAVTHVFINDSSKGYGVFAERMLIETEKIQKR